jgi:lysyl-tRNA synthetase class 2
MSFQNFRNEGMDRTHNPEFTAINICSLQRLQLDDEICRRPFRVLCCCGKRNEWSYFGEHKINFKAPYARVDDSIKHFTGFDISGKSEAELFDAAKGMGIDVDATMGKGKLIDEILS